MMRRATTDLLLAVLLLLLGSDVQPVGAPSRDFNGVPLAHPQTNPWPSCSARGCWCAASGRPQQRSAPRVPHEIRPCEPRARGRPAQGTMMGARPLIQFCPSRPRLGMQGWACRAGRAGLSVQGVDGICLCVGFGSQMLKDESETGQKAFLYGTHYSTPGSALPWPCHALSCALTAALCFPPMDAGAVCPTHGCGPCMSYECPVLPHAARSISRHVHHGSCISAYGAALLTVPLLPSIFAAVMCVLVRMQICPVLAGARCPCAHAPSPGKAMRQVGGA